MSKATLRASISRILNRGTRFDGIIDEYVAEAVILIETNYTFKYTERYVDFQLNSALPTSEVMEYPGRLKEMKFVRIIRDGTADASSEDAYKDLDQVDPADLANLPVRMPSGYWIDGDDYLRLNAKPDKSYYGNLSYNQFTDWANLADGVEIWLEKYARNLLKAQTIVLLGPETRNIALAQTFSALLPQLQKAAIEADASLRQSDSESSAEFGTNYDEDDDV